ncbi:MAG: cytosine permease [Tessaracoccus sp.]
MANTESAVGVATAPSEPDIDYSLEPVPLSARRGFWSVGFVMLGFTFFSASMSVGAKLGNGLDFSGFALAVLIGGLILGVYTGFLAYIGAKTGLSMDLMSHHAFGTQGSFLPSALIAITQMGWFGVGVAMFALPAAELLGISPWILVLVAGGLMTASAYYGIKAIEIVSYISVPLIAILGTYSMITATQEGGGLVAIFEKSQGLGLLAGVGMVVGSFVSGGTATPNFTRFAGTARSAVVTTVIAFFLGNTLMFAFGAVGGAFTGKDDIFYVMIAQGLAIPALLVLGANIWTTNNNALYTTGLGFSNITKIRKRPLVLIAGVIGTLSALWLYDNFVGWLNFLSTALPPIGAILIVDFLRHRSEYLRELRPTRPVNVGAVVGVIAGGLAGWAIPWGITSINAMAIAVACYLAGEAINSRRPRDLTPLTSGHGPAVDIAK